MAASNAYMNSSGWTFTAGTVYSIGKVKGWSMPRGMERQRESADYDHYNTLSVCSFEDPMISLDTLDAMIVQLIPASAVGILTGIVRDCNNGATPGGGGKQITLTNASIADANSGGQHRQFARGSTTFCAFSTDGLTPPLSIVAL